MCGVFSDEILQQEPIDRANMLLQLTITCHIHSSTLAGSTLNSQVLFLNCGVFDYTRTRFRISTGL